MASEDLVRELLRVAREQLAHMAGDQYSKAVVTCLDGSFDEYAEDEKDTSKMHKAFGKLVLDVLVWAAHGL